MSEDEFQLGFVRAEKSLYLVAMGYLHNSEDARDAVQEAAETAYRSRDKLRNKQYFKTWITRILINKCKDFLRGQRFTAELTDGIGIFDDIPHEEICLMDAICRLEPKEAKFITLRFYADLTFEEESRVLKMPVSTIKYGTRKALEKLKAMMEV